MLINIQHHRRRFASLLFVDIIARRFFDAMTDQTRNTNRRVRSFSYFPPEKRETQVDPVIYHQLSLSTSIQWFIEIIHLDIIITLVVGLLLLLIWTDEWCSFYFSLSRNSFVYHGDYPLSIEKRKQSLFMHLNKPFPDDPFHKSENNIIDAFFTIQTRQPLFDD